MASETKVQRPADYEPLAYKRHVAACKVLKQQPVPLERWNKLQDDKFGFLNASTPVDHIW